MRLTKEEKEICEKYSEYDETGHVHCHDCPLAADMRYAMCKANMSAKEWKEHVEMLEWKEKNTKPGQWYGGRKMQREETEEVRKSIRIKYHDPGMPRISKISIGDWIDLRAAETIVMKKGEFKMFPLGVSMELPKGYEAIIAPRSSTFRKYGIILVNSIGIIDESFNGDGDQWQYLALAMRDTVIPKYERICQFRLMAHQPPVEFIEVLELGNKDRGGIGSTGRS